MEYCDQLIKFSLIMLHEYPVFGIIYSAVSALFALTAILGNVILIYALWDASSINRTSKILLLSLAASDLSVGLLVHPLNAAMMIQMLRLSASNDEQDATLLLPLVKTDLFFSLFSGAASLFIVGAISIDRYLAISIHLRYAVLVTPRRVRLVVFAIWITSFTAALLQSLQYFSPMISIVGVVLVMAVASFSYFKIFSHCLSSSESNLCSKRSAESNLPIADIRSGSKVSQESSLHLCYVCNLLFSFIIYFSCI